jgi:hypothetical protein
MENRIGTGGCTLKPVSSMQGSTISAKKDFDVELFDFV